MSSSRSLLKLEDWVTIGKGTTLQPGVQFSDGFQVSAYKHIEKNFLAPHYGSVSIGNHCSIGSNCCIDRGLGKDDVTQIGNHVMLDNLVHIAHNCKIEDNCILAAGVILGGSVHIKKNTFVGLNATIKHGIKVGENVTIGMGAVVIRNVPDGVTIAGNPAQQLKED